MRNLIPVTGLVLLITAFSVAAQNQRGPKPAVAPETLALYEPGEFKGLFFGSFTGPHYFIQHCWSQP